MNVKAMFKREEPPMTDITRQIVKSAPLARRTLSEQAAEAAQAMIDLEDEVARLQQESQAWERSATLAEGERDQLRADLAQMTHKMEGYQSRCQKAEAQFEMLGKCVLEAMQTLRGDSGYAPKPELMRKIAQEINSVDVVPESGGDESGMKNPPKSDQ